MNLDELQSVQSRERQTDSLQQLRADFYEDAAEFVKELRERRNEAAAEAEDPFDSPDVNRLTDDIRTAEQTVEAIYERRVGKVVKMASLAAADMPTEDAGLTKEERELFETMVEAIETHRTAILTTLGGDAPTGEVSPQPRDDAVSDGESALDASAVMGEGDAETTAPLEQDAAADTTGDGNESSGGPDQSSEEADQSSGEGDQSTADADQHTGAFGNDAGSDTRVERERAADDAPDPEGEQSGQPAAEPGQSASEGDMVDRVTVRITTDVGEIFGVDEREYDLATDDVVTLPATNAEPLIDRDAAEPLE